MSLNAYHKHPSLSRMPRYVRVIVLEKLGNFWGLSEEREKIKDKLIDLQNSMLLKNNSDTLEVLNDKQEIAFVSVDENIECKNRKRFKNTAKDYDHNVTDVLFENTTNDGNCEAKQGLANGFANKFQTVEHFVNIGQLQFESGADALKGIKDVDFFNQNGNVFDANGDQE